MVDTAEILQRKVSLKSFGEHKNSTVEPLTSTAEPLTGPKKFPNRLKFNFDVDRSKPGK